MDETERKDQLNYVRLDVGHYLYLCHIDVLRKHPNSVLAKLVAPEFDKRTSSNDFIIIDRDGKWFGLILDYLRDESSLDLRKLNENQLLDLIREANFYCLSELEEKCHETLDTLLRFTTSKNYALPIISNYKKYLKDNEKPTVVLDSNWLSLLAKTGMLDKVAAMADRKLYDIIGTTEIIGRTLTPRAYWPGFAWPEEKDADSADNGKPRQGPSRDSADDDKPRQVVNRDSAWVVLCMCAFLMQTDLYLRRRELSKQAHLEELAELEHKRRNTLTRRSWRWLVNKKREYNHRRSNQIT